MPHTPALADMRSLLDAYFRSAGTTESGSSEADCWLEKPLPMHPPSLPDWDSVFTWSWLRRVAPDEGIKEDLDDGLSIEPESKRFKVVYEERVVAAKMGSATRKMSSK